MEEPAEPRGSGGVQSLLGWQECLVETPGQEVETPGQEVETTGQEVETTGQEEVETSGQEVEIPGQEVETTGQEEETPGQEVTALPTLGIPMVRGSLYPNPRPNSTICSWAALRTSSRATTSSALTPADKRTHRLPACGVTCVTVATPASILVSSLPDCRSLSDSFSRVITSSSSPSEKITSTWRITG
uniref:Uncharacterized protein n=1 Tax=Poecilia mexicana TaxID=48701 RepID=A0A3B3XCC7_9TELE